MVKNNQDYVLMSKIAWTKQYINCITNVLQLNFNQTYLDICSGRISVKLYYFPVMRGFNFIIFSYKNQYNLVVLI